MLSFDLDKIKAFQPRVIILELGTNDLCVAGQRPETIGSDMERLVQQVLHEHCGAVFIMVCLVIFTGLPFLHTSPISATKQTF